MKDYDCYILYPIGEANIVANGLTRKSSSSWLILQNLSKPVQEKVCRVEIEIVTGTLATMTFLIYSNRRVN